MKKLSVFIKGLVIAVLTLSLFITVCFAHPGRTDSDGGHHDYNNVSGLGSYHYHNGFPAHLHEDGLCPYVIKGGTTKDCTGASKSGSSIIKKDKNTNSDTKSDTASSSKSENGIVKKDKSTDSDAKNESKKRTFSLDNDIVIFLCSIAILFVPSLIAGIVNKIKNIYTSFKK